MNKDKLKTKHELWRRGVLTWKLHKGQKRVYESLKALPKPIREAVILISRRWGKSYLGVIMALEDCLKNPGVQVMIIGPDLKQTRKIITPIINKIIKDAPSGLIKQTKSELTWTIGESTLMIGAFDTALESTRGLEAFNIYLEESAMADENEYEYTLSSVLRPTLMHSRGRITHLTTPPRSENHPFVTETMPEASINNALHIYTIHDNPLLSAQDIADEIKSMGGKDNEHCKRELFCQIVPNKSSIIVPEFDDRHIKTLDVPAYTYFLTSIDFGGVKDNHAILLGYYDFVRRKRCYVDEQWLDINTGTNDVLEAVRSLEARNSVKWLFGHPLRIVDAPGQTMVDIRRLDLECRPPDKGKDSVEDGIQALRVAFLNDEIEIDPRCKMLILTLKHAQWDKNRKDFQRTKTLGHCDMLAALSYHFRHQNIYDNPIPQNLGLNAVQHYFEPAKPTDTLTTLNDLFYGD